MYTLCMHYTVVMPCYPCLTSNHIQFQYVTDIGVLYLKGGSPAGGILDSSRLYAYIWNQDILMMFPILDTYFFKVL